jgi:DNA-binding LacI/PurR family transcriptional regulator
MEVLSVAQELRLRVPEDLGIAGYDNIMFCDFTQNAISSIDQAGEMLGSHAARLLLDRIDGRADVDHIVLRLRLVAGNSSKGSRNERRGLPLAR